MYQNQKRDVDRMDPYRPTYLGTYEGTVTVGDKKRRYLV